MTSHHSWINMHCKRHKEDQVDAINLLQHWPIDSRKEMVGTCGTKLAIMMLALLVQEKIEVGTPLLLACLILGKRANIYSSTCGKTLLKASVCHTHL
jgi:hypothetical protein